MTARTTTATLSLGDRILVNTNEAATLLGISRDTFREVVAPEVRAVMVKRRQHWPVEELKRWVNSRMQAAAYD